MVVAIHGNALGGGLEVAQACHYRVASADAKVGQPEVNLGIIPGAGGTQRLPRLAGIAKAVEMCTIGKTIKAAEAVEAGIIDKLIEGDLLAGAVAFAREVAGKPAPKTRELQRKIGNAGDECADLCRRARYGAQETCADCRRRWRRSTRSKLPPSCRLKRAARKRRGFSTSALYSDESKALIHVFLRRAGSGENSGRAEGYARDSCELGCDRGRRNDGRRNRDGLCANAGIPVVLKDYGPGGA